MYISKITLKNIRCFENETIDLTSRKGVKKWLVILGDNGTGKSTILRSIAMGLCDETGAAGLLQDTSGDWIREGVNEGWIILNLNHRGKEYEIKTHIIKKSLNKEVVEQETTPKDDFPWRNIFVCGYGANRNIEGDSSHDRYSPADAVYTLFNYDYDLHSPELMLRRYGETPEERKEICFWLDDVLMLDRGSVNVDLSGISIKKKGRKEKHYFGALADGHAAMMTLVLDMLGWALLAKKKKFKNKLSGIILIDELEQHLHPKWQRSIIELLHSVFENIQFISTSHSALCAIGTANLKNTRQVCSLAHLSSENDRVEIKDKIEPPLGERADQILTSFLFGLPTSSSDYKQEAINRYAELMSKKRSPSEKRELKRLGKFLDDSVGKAETAFEKSVSAEVMKTIHDRTAKAVGSTTGKNAAVSYEVLRLLRKIS